MSYVVVLAYIFLWDKKTSNIPTKVDADATGEVTGLNKNEQEPGGINKNADVTDWQQQKEISTTNNVTNVETDADMGLKDDAIFKKNVITGTQYDPQELTSITGET